MYYNKLKQKVTARRDAAPATGVHGATRMRCCQTVHETQLRGGGPLRPRCVIPRRTSVPAAVCLFVAAKSRRFQSALP